MSTTSPDVTIVIPKGFTRIKTPKKGDLMLSECTAGAPGLIWQPLFSDRMVKEALAHAFHEETYIRRTSRRTRTTGA